MSTKSLTQDGNLRGSTSLELLNIRRILGNIPFKRSYNLEYIKDPYTVRISRGNIVYDVVITCKVTIGDNIFFEYVEIDSSGNLVECDELISFVSIAEGGDEEGNEFEIPKKYSEVFMRAFPLKKYFSILEP